MPQWVNWNISTIFSRHTKHQWLWRKWKSITRNTIKVSECQVYYQIPSLSNHYLVHLCACCMQNCHPINNGIRNIAKISNSLLVCSVWWFFVKFTEMVNVLISISSIHRWTKTIWIFIEIFASMFFWRYVCLLVCLSFCLSVCLGRDTGHNYLTIVTKLGPHLKSFTGKNPIVFLGQRSNN